MLLCSGTPGDPGQLTALTDLSTSSSITTSWTSGRDGNHPPLEHTNNYTDYITITSTQHTYIEYIIETLDADRLYDIRVVANNDRGENKTNSRSYEYICNVNTTSKYFRSFGTTI